MTAVTSAALAVRPSTPTALTAAIADITAPVPLSRRIGVVAARSGVGCSSVGGLIVRTLSRYRTGRLLAVDASGEPQSALWNAGLDSSVPASQLDAPRRASARTGAEATDGLLAAPGGAWGLTLDGQDAASIDALWREHVAPSNHFFELTVTDWGAAGTASAAFGSSHLLCVVTDVSRRGLVEASDFAHASGHNPASIIVVAVDAEHRIRQSFRQTLARIPFELAVIPFDRALPGRKRLSLATRFAAIQLTGAAVAGTMAPNGRATR